MTAMNPAPPVDGSAGRPELRGIHHLKLAVSDLARSLDFYQRVFAAERLVAADHYREDGSLYAHIAAVPGLGTLLELRLDPEQAARHAGFDPITIAVADRAALADWDRQLTVAEAPHSPILVSIQAWLIVIEDPDRTRLRLYTLEQHGPELTPDHDNPWLDAHAPAVPDYRTD